MEIGDGGMGGRIEGGGDQSSGVGGVAADGEVVLVVGVGEDGDQLGQGVGVGALGEVDVSAGVGGVFQVGGAGESDGLGLGGVSERVARVDAGGLGGEVPQGDGWLGLGVGLGEDEVEVGAGGGVGVMRVGCFVEGQERDDGG